MTVYFHSNVKDHTGGEGSFEIAADQAQNLQELIDILGDHYGPGLRDFLSGEGNCFFLVNGSGIAATGGLRTPVGSRDKVEILPFVQGG